MAHEDRTDLADDGDLVAYLDGELPPKARAALEEKIARDPALANRLAVLQSGERPFRQAFDAVLEAAPSARLAAMLDEELRRGEGRRPARRQLPAWAAIAASFVMLVAGLAVGYGVGSIGVPEFLEGAIGNSAAESDAWGQMLASDLARYTPESLAMIGPEQAPSDDALKALGAKFDVALSADRLALPGLALKQARLLAFRGTPFIQLIYSDPQHGAVAFCIFAESGGVEAPESSRTAGMNLVYWTDDRQSYMLIGSAPVPDLQNLAGSLAKTFPPSDA